jgi:hypothetical protein
MTTNPRNPKPQTLDPDSFLIPGFDMERVQLARPKPRIPKPQTLDPKSCLIPGFDMERVQLARSNGLLHPERRAAIFGGEVGDYDPPDPMEKAAMRAAEVYPRP